MSAPIRPCPPPRSAHILPTSTKEALSPRREKGPLTCCLTSSGGIIGFCDRRLRRRVSPQVSGTCMGICTPLELLTPRSKHTGRTPVIADHLSLAPALGPPSAPGRPSSRRDASTGGAHGAAPLNGALPGEGR